MIQRKECTLLCHKTKDSLTCVFGMSNVKAKKILSPNCMEWGTGHIWLGSPATSAANSIKYTAVSELLCLSKQLWGKPCRASKYNGSPGLWSPTAPHINLFTDKHQLFSLFLYLCPPLSIPFVFLKGVDQQSHLMCHVGWFSTILRKCPDY